MRDPRNYVEIDHTSDSCAVLVWCTPDQADDLGWSIGGSSIEDAGDGQCYAMVGLPWSDDHTDAENDAEHDHAWRECIRDLTSAGLDWEEV